MARVAVLAGEGGEAQEAVGGARVARGYRVVLEVLAPRDEPLVVDRGLEEAAALAVGEALDHRVGGRAGGGEPAWLEARLVQGEERLDQVGVVLEVGVEARLAVLGGAQEAPARVAHRTEDEVGARARRVEVARLPQYSPRVGERGDHERVPRAQALVVEPRPHALRPRLVQAPA